MFLYGNRRHQREKAAFANYCVHFIIIPIFAFHQPLLLRLAFAAIHVGICPLSAHLTSLYVFSTQFVLRWGEGWHSYTYTPNKKFKQEDKRPPYQKTAIINTTIVCVSSEVKKKIHRVHITYIQRSAFFVFASAQIFNGIFCRFRRVYSARTVSNFPVSIRLNRYTN
jgi:hypothetical protein